MSKHDVNEVEPIVATTQDESQTRLSFVLQMGSDVADFTPAWNVRML